MKELKIKKLGVVAALFLALSMVISLGNNVNADVINGAAPIITGSAMEGSNLVVRWENPDGVQYNKYVVYERLTENDEFIRAATVIRKNYYTKHYPQKGMTYYYKIVGVYTDTETGEEKESEPAYTGKCVDSLENPVIINATAGDSHSITITWNKTQDCSGYAIYRSDSVNGSYQWIKNVENKTDYSWWEDYESQATYTEKNLELGKVYYYRIRPYITYPEGTFYGDFSDCKGARVTINGTKVKTASSKKKNTNTISWSKNTEADGYIIYYSKKENGAYKKLKTYTSRNKLTYTHKKLKNGTAYYYKIQAYKNYKGTKLLGQMTAYEKYCDYYTYKYESYESRCRRIFGKSYYKKYKSEKQARKHMTTVVVKVWDKKGGKKFTRRFYLTVNKGIAPSVKQMFKEIYKSKERFPIHEMGCFSWRGKNSTSEHCEGLAFDINSNENYMIDNGKILAGSFWKPKKNKYSIPLNCKLVKILEKYGFERGFWGDRKDYMHFSYFGS